MFFCDFRYFLAEIEGPEQKSDSETKKDCRCCWILTSLHSKWIFWSYRSPIKVWSSAVPRVLMQLLLFFYSIPLVLVLRYHLFFNLMNVMIRDTHHHSHLWTCDWQPPPFYLRLGEYLLNAAISSCLYHEDSDLTEWLARLSGEHSVVRRSTMHRAIRNPRDIH